LKMQLVNSLAVIKKFMTNALLIKIYIFLVLAVSLTFIGYNILAQVEETPSALRKYINVTDCPKLTDVNDLTMKDNCTGLVWAHHELPTFSTAGDATPGYTWQEAKSACENLSPAGMFRLPTVEELLSLVVYKCNASGCLACADAAKDNYGKTPIFSEGIYWAISDFNEPASWHTLPSGKPERDYKRSVNLVKGEVDNPVFGQAMRLNAWCVVNRNPEIVEKKFVSATIASIASGEQSTGGSLKTIYHRQCNTDADCAVLAGTVCTAPICQGPEPDNATLCDNDNLDLPSSAFKTVVANCTDAKKCEYTCNSGYVLSGGNCALVTYSCITALIRTANATLCSAGADNTPAKLALACDGTTQCQFTCNPNYVLAGDHCNALPIIFINIYLSDSFTTNPDLTISAFASDIDGTISKVEFYQDSTKLGETVSSPYDFTLANVAPGTYSFTAKATDNEGASAISSPPISVTITAHSCTDTTPANAALCAGDDSGLADDYSKILVDSCTNTRKCEYTCSSGYTLSGGSCVISQPTTTIVIWVGTTPADAIEIFFRPAGGTYESLGIFSDPTFYPGRIYGTARPLTAGQYDFKLEYYSNLEDPTDTEGGVLFNYDSAKVSINNISYVNTPGSPASSCYSQPGEAQGLPAEITYICALHTQKCTNKDNIPASCTNTTPGSVTFSVTVFPTTFSCTNLPANATICPNADQNLPADTPSSLVASCGTAKCQYTCDTGYTINGAGTACAHWTTGCIGTHPTTPFNYIFIGNSTDISQGYYLGMNHDLAYWDNICQQSANARGLPGTYKAFLSDSTTSAKDRLTHSTIPYAKPCKTDGLGAPVPAESILVANNWADFTDGTILSAVDTIIPLPAWPVRYAESCAYPWTQSYVDGSKYTGNTCASGESNGAFFMMNGCGNFITPKDGTVSAVTAICTAGAYGPLCMQQSTVATCTNQPTNATLCPAGADDTNANLVGNCTGAKCQYTCNAGYVKSGNTCELITYSCTGTTPDPATATLCPGDDTGLSADTPKTTVATNADCTGVKCEYYCNSGYTLSGGSCLQFRYVFVTSGIWKGNLGGLSGADDKCNNEASGKLPGTYKAWLADSSTSASSRLEHYAGQYRLKDGTIVANNWGDFTNGTLSHAINEDASGNIITSYTSVFTGLDASGAIGTGIHYNCNNWSSSLSSFGGYMVDIGTSMFGDKWHYCDSDMRRLYCLQQPPGIDITADDTFYLYINGVLVKSDGGAVDGNGSCTADANAYWQSVEHVSYNFTPGTTYQIAIKACDKTVDYGLLAQFVYGATTRVTKAGVNGWKCKNVNKSDADPPANWTTLAMGSLDGTWTDPVAQLAAKWSSYVSVFPGADWIWTATAGQKIFCRYDLVF